MIRPLHGTRRVLLACVVSLLAGAIALAQGPSGPTSVHGIRMTRLSAEVRIVDGVATTSLNQILHNDRSVQAEAIWVLPLPENAAADSFTMKVGGVEMKGEVLDAGRARGVYESIVRSRRDPGLLEYVGRGCLRARIFPIPPGSDVEVQVVFRQLLPMTNDLFRWSLPLNAFGFGKQPPELVVLDLSIDSRKPIRNVFSPSAGVHVMKKNDNRARASFEGRGASVSDKALTVFYGLSDEEFGLDLLSYRKEGEEEGSFLMMVSPKDYWAGQVNIEKEITFVLDTSGSMGGSKIVQAKEAIRLFLNSLNPEDHFNVIPFSTGAEPFFAAPVLASGKNLESALALVARVDATGGTNIADALDAALGRSTHEENRLPIVVFLTDGKPTVGETDANQLLRDAVERNHAGARIFVFGVGDDVNTILLDKLAAQNGGARDYVRQNETIEAKTSALFTKLSNPVLTDIELRVDGVEISRSVPAHLPDLFKGGRILLYGRYLGEGDHAIHLSGRVGNQDKAYVYEGSFASEPKREHDFVPVLWAERRVGVLLDAIRMNGADGELLDEVARLGREYNIVTPYTAHLIVEEGLELSGVPTNTFEGPRRGAAWQGHRGPVPIPDPPGGGGGGGGGGPSTPGPAGPSAPGPSGPATPGPAGPAAPGGGGPAQPTTMGGRSMNLDRIVALLLDAGVLPADATRQELVALARDIAREMRSSEESLRKLGRRQSGTDAVNDSAYLARLIGQSVSPGSRDSSIVGGQKASLLALFTRKVGDKVFRLRQGIWIDLDYDEETMAERKQRIEAYSAEYFAIVGERPKINIYLAFSDRLLVVIDEQVIEVVPPGKEREERAADEK